ncbi:LysR family transcriptional regulator [Burkholderia cepacia]|uniref:LysR family regulatory protein n=1 Tax=Burkholderia cepacia GG4 TaxID=1009846 RepID=A0A9W3K572_BURCE|nr:LysR family transcriptional regulator [Burkholderia cepacia]AFQ51114.1 putative LysR family regulatory protein [Burkholderia cepacia GG4]
MSKSKALPSLKSLTAFEAVVRLGSMTAAAKELDSTQPAISQRIRALEDTIGIVLFDRTGARLVPTRQGRILYDEVSSSLSRIEGTIRGLQADVTPQRHKITIAAHFGFAHLWLLPKLPLIEETFPNIQFEILPVDRADDKEMVQADISIRFGRYDCIDGSDQLLESEVVFPICSPAFAARYRLGDIHEVDLSHVPLLHMDTDDVRWLDWEQWCRLAGVTPSNQTPSIRYNNYPLMMSAVKEGRGMALGWSTLVRDMIAEGSLVALQPTVRRPNFGYILHSRYRDNAVLVPLMRWMLQQFDVVHSSNSGINVSGDF